MLVITHDSVEELLVSSVGVRYFEVFSYLSCKGSNATFALVSVFSIERTLDNIKLVK